jgi:hypothetical protein
MESLRLSTCLRLHCGWLLCSGSHVEFQCELDAVLCGTFSCHVLHTHQCSRFLDKFESMRIKSLCRSFTCLCVGWGGGFAMVVNFCTCQGPTGQESSTKNYTFKCDQGGTCYCIEDAWRASMAIIGFFTAHDS